jgi:hypothetical protein
MYSKAMYNSTADAIDIDTRLQLCDRVPVLINMSGRMVQYG